MARIICVANQKGGVGKTTTAVNLAVALAKAGMRTLLIDLDPQCNATGGLGHAPAERHPLLVERALRESLLETATPNLQLLPGSRLFADVQQLSSRPEPHLQILERHLSTGMTSYDAVLIDCPPSLGELTRTALAHAGEVLMPIQCEFYAMEGLAQMIEVIREVMRVREGQLQFGGILLTMFDAGLELTYEVEREVREFFGEIVFQTVIPRDVAVSEAPSHGQSVLDYAPRSRGSWAYMELAREVLSLA